MKWEVWFKELQKAGPNVSYVSTNQVKVTLTIQIL